MDKSNNLKVVLEFREPLFKENFLKNFTLSWRDQRGTIAEKFRYQYPLNSIKEIDGNIIWREEN